MENQVTESQKLLVLKKIFSQNIELFGSFFFPHHLKLEAPEFHKEIYRLYEDLANKRIVIAAPRGHAKSTITDLVFLAWCLVHRYSHFVLLVSDTYSQATLFLDALKAELEANEKLIAFYGKLTSDNWSEGEIISNGVMVKALGAGMKVRGLKYKEYRPDLVLIDDLENDELVENKDRREKLERWVNGALFPSMSKEGRLIIIGTILHYDSILSKLLNPTSYIEFTKRIYRAISDSKALWPEHLSLTELERIKYEYASRGQGYLFYQEYQNDPVSDENRRFKVEKLRYYTEADIVGKQLKTYITIDRAYSKDKTADSTGISVVSVDRDNNWYIRLAERFKGTEKELIEKVFDLKNYYLPLKIGIEQKAFQYTIKPAFDDEMRRRNTFFVVDELKDLGRAKNIRIEGLIPRFETGSVYLRPDQTDLVDELIMFPKGIHDDLIDSLAYQLEIAVGKYEDQVALQYVPKKINRTPFYPL